MVKQKNRRKGGAPRRVGPPHKPVFINLPPVLYEILRCIAKARTTPEPMFQGEVIHRPAPIATTQEIRLRLMESVGLDQLDFPTNGGPSHRAIALLSSLKRGVR